jgi:hypothetical protein
VLHTEATPQEPIGDKTGNLVLTPERFRERLAERPRDETRPDDIGAARLDLGHELVYDLGKKCLSLRGDRSIWLLGDAKSGFRLDCSVNPPYLLYSMSIGTHRRYFSPAEATRNTGQSNHVVVLRGGF